MLYAKVEDKFKILKYPYRIHEELPLVSFPDPITEEILNEYNLVVVAPCSDRAYLQKILMMRDQFPEKYEIREVLPIYKGGRWEQQFILHPIIFNES